MRVVFLSLVCLLLSVPALAQTNPVPASQPFTVAFDHDGVNVTGFQCVLDGKPLGAVLPSTGRACAIPGLAVGPHTIVVESVNAFGKTGSPSLTATAGVPPNGPTNLRIVVQVAVLPDGSVSLIAANVDTVK